MTAEEDALLRTLEARVTQMALEYKALKDRYAALSRIMEEKNATIAALHSQVDRLQTDYANLKTAKMIDISSEDMKNAKSRLSKLVASDVPSFSLYCCTFQIRSRLYRFQSLSNLFRKVFLASALSSSRYV